MPACQYSARFCCCTTQVSGITIHATWTIALSAMLCRTTKKGYEEVHVPALKPKPFADNEKLVAIQELPEWAQPAFGGMQSLNRVQSRVSDCALYSSENMLVCAPTGRCRCWRLCACRNCVPFVVVPSVLLTTKCLSVQRCRRDDI